MPRDTVLKRGALAYLDTFSAGLVPCKVIAVKARDCVEVRTTAPRRGYPRGETHVWGARGVVPRGAVYRRRGSAFLRIRPYATEFDSEGATNGQ